jgi:hypothetical protein
LVHSTCCIVVENIITINSFVILFVALRRNHGHNIGQISKQAMDDDGDDDDDYDEIRRREKVILNLGFIL